MKTAQSNPSIKLPGLLAVGVLVGILALLFWRSFLPDYVHFSNDGPLGQQNVDWFKPAKAIPGLWDDLNDVGFAAGSFSPSISGLIKFALGPVGFAKLFPPITLIILGLGAWTFFRALKLSSLAALLGALAAMLGSAFFAGACWGVASVEIAIGLDFFALALIFTNNPETPWLIRWPRLALAGLCVGMNVIEAADVGALCSMFIAGLVFFKSLVDAGRNLLTKSARGFGRVAIVAVFAGFISIQTVLSLVGISITGIAGTAQDTETKSQHWDFATQWSLPKLETLGLFVPGLFGYKMDTPNNMMPQFQKWYEGGVYWGGIGRTPEIDRFFDSGSQGQMPPGSMRFSGGGNYCGILVALLAAWAVAQSFRRQNSPFSEAQKNLIWFFLAILVGSLVLAWGRFAPFSKSSNDFLFYAFLYKLPYFSTIRNPAKFLVFFCLALVILFAFGVQALSQRYLEGTATKPAGFSKFDRKWTLSCVGFFVASVLGWLIFAAGKNSLIGYLQKMGYPDESLAQEIAAFSIGQVGWFVGLFAMAILLVTLVIAGYFSGPRAKIGAGLLGAFLIFDLGRADLPYVIHWDYKQKYEVGSLNPVVDFLRNQPYEHRVASLPFRGLEGTELLDQIYRIEWMQHHFPYYNIQCLDWIQMPRIAEDLKMYLEPLSANGTFASLPLMARRWQLANTPYLLGPTVTALPGQNVDTLSLLNDALDPAQKRFRILQRFEIVPKPGILQPQRLEELTAILDEKGRYALFNFTGALPRAKLFANWQVNTNDQANLKMLADMNFDPLKTVLISTPQKDLPAVATNENSGTVEFKSYEPKHLVFAANAAATSVLLLNDKYDPNWHVTVDDHPAELLRCNFLMRGVQVPPGQHTVVFYYQLPNQALYVTLVASLVGLILAGYLYVATKRKTANT
jgi:hypothetical protein